MHGNLQRCSAQDQYWWHTWHNLGANQGLINMLR